MALKIYNTLSRSVEPFKSITPGKVGMYVCGVTVYDDCHIGHGRTFIAFDVARRWLQESGYDVKFVRNVTDVDDKIIKRAAERKILPSELAETYTKRMQEDLEELGCLPPSVEPRATQYIPKMLALIEKLEEKGYAYQDKNGDVDFSVRKFKPYGALSGKKVDELQPGERVKVEEAKQDPLDFALWKRAKPGEPEWDSKWGKGRPGWHIECSAMSCDLLGETFDIHGGGPDLMFPHHENEIAQSEAANGKKFVNTWMHSGPLRVNGEKMSKSRGNVVDPNDVVDEYGADVLRLYVLFMGDYEKAAPWSESSVKGCKRFVDRIWALQDKVVDSNEYSDKLRSLMHKTIKKVSDDIESMKFNTAIAAMMTLLNEIYNVGSITKKEFRDLLIILNPFAPHVTEELYQMIGCEGVLDEQEWVTYDEALCKDDTIEIVCQINGKVKSKLTIPTDAAKDDVIALAKADEAIVKATEGKNIVKEIYVPNKLVNLVVK